jgi:hypothetical protein
MSDRKRSRLEVASWIGGIAGAVIAFVALIVDIRSKSGEADSRTVTSEKIATSIPCGQLGKAFSESSVSSEDVGLAFTNAAGNTARVRWIDEAAKVIANSGSDIPSTKNWSVTTSKSHVWLISSEAGVCLGIVSAGERNSIVKITDRGLAIRLAPAAQGNFAVSIPSPKICSGEKTLTFSPNDPGVMQNRPDGQRINLGDGGGGTHLEEWKIGWTAPAKVTSVECSGRRNEHVLAQNKDGSHAECVGSINGGSDALSMLVKWDGPCDQP